MDVDLRHARNRNQIRSSRRRVSARESGREGLGDADRGAHTDGQQAPRVSARAAAGRAERYEPAGHLDDIEFPDGAHIPLPQMPGADTAGYPGFADLIKNHYARTWTPAVLISGITAATMLASRPTYGGINGYSP